MARSQAVLEDPYFQQALGFAKGVARQIDAQSLSPLLLVVSLEQVSRRGFEFRIARATRFHFSMNSAGLS
jgi:hypothetical protein